MVEEAPDRIPIQFVTGPDSSGIDIDIQYALESGNHGVHRIDADEFIRNRDSSGLRELLNPSATTTVIASGARWTSLIDLVGRDLFPNPIVITSNRALTIGSAYMAKLTLNWPDPQEGSKDLLDAVDLLNSTAGGSWQAFEKYSRRFMALHIGLKLEERSLGNVPKRFDMVSESGNVIGDAKFFGMVRGSYEPPAKYAEISALVWLLEKTSATRRFLVFGKDRRVPEGWLNRYRALVPQIEFYFLADYGNLSRLN